MLALPCRSSPRSVVMVDGFWEVDVAKKANSSCARCGNAISTSELRFQFCPLAAAPKDRPFYHLACAVKAGTSGSAAPVSKTSVRKASGLTGAQRDQLASVLEAPGKAARSALLSAAQGAQAGGLSASGGAGKAAGKASAVKQAQGAADGPSARSARRAPAQRQQQAAAVAMRPSAAPAAVREAATKRKAVQEPAAPPSGKRARSEAGAAAASAISQKELCRFQKEKQSFASWTNDKLKALLKANDQSRSGNKEVLLAKCADGAAFGKLPRCPTCFGGKIKFRIPGPDGSLCSVFKLHGGAYGEDKDSEQRADKAPAQKRRFYCTGYFDDDEKVECDWQADKVKREPWVAAP